jgi:hypothetical protein
MTGTLILFDTLPTNIMNHAEPALKAATLAKKNRKNKIKTLLKKYTLNYIILYKKYRVS